MLAKKFTIQTEEVSQSFVA